MNTADKQVIDMVNEQYERLRRRELRLQAQVRGHRDSKAKRAVKHGLLWLIVRLELYLITAGVMLMAVGYGWLTVDLGTLGLLCSIAAGFLDLWRFARGC